MSWSLLNHNYDRPAYIPPTVPQNPVATNVYVHPNPQSDASFDFLMAGMQITKAGDTILCSTSHTFEYVRSDDAGATWSVKTTPYSNVNNLPAYSQNQYAICPVTDYLGNWYYRIGRVDSSTNYSHPARSLDDGVSFALFDANKLNSNVAPDWGLIAGMTHQLMQTSGVLVSQGNQRIVEFSDPANANTSGVITTTGAIVGCNSVQLDHYFMGPFYQYTNTTYLATYDVSTNTKYLNQTPGGVNVDENNWATDGVKVLAGHSHFQSGTGTYWVYYPNTTPVLHTFDDIGVNAQGATQQGLGFFYGNGIFIAAWYYTTPSPEYRNKIYFKTSPTGLTGSWSTTNILTLSRNKEEDTTRRARYINIIHHSDDLWYIMYIQNGAITTGNFTVIDSFQIAQTVQHEYSLLNAVNAQAPDIFYKSDDEAGSTELFDLGRQHYTNSVVGTVNFERDSLIDDGGNSIRFNSASNTGVLVESVPTPASHAHFFVLNHDGTASVRILACSGDYSDTGAIGYYVFLAANHKLGVAVYDGGWEYHYSTAALTASTTYLAAVSIASNGKVTFYIGNVWDSAVENVPYETITSTMLSVGGGWTGALTLGQCASGVTVDYYALIPLSSFNYKLLVEANGGTYTGPTVDSGSVDGVVFLVHGNESALDPVIVNSVRVYEAINSVPGSTNRIHNAYSDTPLTPVGKFGAGALYNRVSTENLVTTPWYCSYWNEGHLTQIGTQDFTYDVQVSAEWDNGLCYPACSSGLYRRSTRYYRFGGIIIKMSKASATTANISIYVGCTLEQALLGMRDSLELSYLNVPGYIDANYNHVAVCRYNGEWFVFLNGTKAGIPSVVRRNGALENTVPILAGGQWLLGGVFDVGLISQPFRVPRFYCPPSKFDEARLIIGRAEFIEPFTPPTAPYDYG